MKFRVQNADADQQTVVDLFLEEGDKGTVLLKARDCTGQIRALMRFERDGMYRRCPFAGGLLGIVTDVGSGKIREAKT